MSKRLFYVKLNIDEFASMVAGLDTCEEYKMFLDGFLVGTRGFESRDTWPEAKRTGYKIGKDCFDEAARFSQKQRDRVSTRYQNSTSELPEVYRGSTVELPGVYPSNNQQLTTNKEQSTIYKKPAKKGGLLDSVLSREEAEVFNAIWKAWPERSDGKPSRGKRIPAEKAFKKLIQSGATLEELKQVAAGYHNHHDAAKGYVQYLSTFFGEQGWCPEGIIRLRAQRKEAIEHAKAVING